MIQKAYIKPEQRVVLLQHRTMLLSGSPYDSVSTPLDTYDDPEDIITDKGSIW